MEFLERHCFRPVKGACRCCAAQHNTHLAASGFSWQTSQWIRRFSQIVVALAPFAMRRLTCVYVQDSGYLCVFLDCVCVSSFVWVTVCNLYWGAVGGVSVWKDALPFTHDWLPVCVCAPSLLISYWLLHSKPIKTEADLSVESIRDHKLL